MKNKKGTILIAIYMVMLVLSIFAAAFLSRSINQNRVTLIFKYRTQAFNLDEAGLDNAITWLRAQPVAPIGNQTNPWGGAQNLGSGVYSVNIIDLGAPGGVADRKSVV